MSKKQTQEGLTIKKEEDFSEWFTQLVIKADLADYTKVSGCIVFKPTSWEIWEKIQEEVNKQIKKINVKNVYFPLFIPEKLLEKESSHIEGFSPEVAWVTQAGNSELNERLAVRPTSEAIMYDSFSKWIRSHRDLPLKYNQWSNVVRWEFRHPIPFFRTREFVFNEGHTVFTTKKEAEEEGEFILNMYKKILEDMLALPSIIGRKSEKEKFAGAEYTISVECFLPNGRAIQGPDFHHDGQNFAKAYNITFLDKNGKKQHAWQNTWAISTRMLGVMFAIHSDNKGLVLPPKIAPNKIVIIPILIGDEKERKNILEESNKIKQELKKYTPLLDDRQDYSPGWKFNEWELKGIPLRIEIGPKDLNKKQAVIVRRDDGSKKIVKISGLKKEIETTLEKIQESLYKKAENLLKSSIVEVSYFNEFTKAIKAGRLVKVEWCGRRECEEEIKEHTKGAKSINTPLEGQPKKLGKCFHCNEQACGVWYFAKSY